MILGSMGATVGVASMVTLQIALDDGTLQIPLGEDGTDGNDGTDGADGKDGTDGINGTQGPPGEDGQDGEDGEDGEDGAQGLPGEDCLEGPLMLTSGTYTGKQMFGKNVVIPEGEVVIFEFAEILGAEFYVYGELTIKNCSMDHYIHAFGNSLTQIKDTIFREYGALYLHEVAKIIASLNLLELSSLKENLSLRDYM